MKGGALFAGQCLVCRAVSCLQDIDVDIDIDIDIDVDIDIDIHIEMEIEIEIEICLPCSVLYAGQCLVCKAVLHTARSNEE